MLETDINKESLLKLVEEVKQHYIKDPIHGSNHIDRALAEIIVFKDVFTEKEFEDIVEDIYSTRVKAISLRKDVI